VYSTNPRFVCFEALKSSATTHLGTAESRHSDLARPRLISCLPLASPLYWFSRAKPLQPANDLLGVGEDYGGARRAGCRFGFRGRRVAGPARRVTTASHLQRSKTPAMSAAATCAGERRGARRGELRSGLRRASGPKSMDLSYTYRTLRLGGSGDAR
jgi:hypothetical protein